MEVARRSYRKKAGFSLVEMIAALVIFSVGVLALMEVFTTCLHSTSHSLNSSQAAQLAQLAVEETIAMGDLYATADTGDFGPVFAPYSWSREIEDTDQLGLYKLQVTVTWEERGRQKQFTLTTFVAERE
jgi:prepilin-type N-terminal cleavage/methylation domain-containing protein